MKDRNKKGIVLAPHITEQSNADKSISLGQAAAYLVSINSLRTPITRRRMQQNIYGQLKRAVDAKRPENRIYVDEEGKTTIGDLIDWATKKSIKGQNLFPSLPDNLPKNAVAHFSVTDALTLETGICHAIIIPDDLPTCQNRIEELEIENLNLRNNLAVLSKDR